MQPLDQYDKPRTLKAYRSFCKQFFVTETHEVIPIAEIPEEYRERYSFIVERSPDTCTCDSIEKAFTCPFASADGDNCNKRPVTPNDFYGITAKRPLNILG